MIFYRFCQPTSESESRIYSKLPNSFLDWLLPYLVSTSLSSFSRYMFYLEKAAEKRITIGNTTLKVVDKDSPTCCITSRPLHLQRCFTVEETLHSVNVSQNLELHADDGDSSTTHIAYTHRVTSTTTTRRTFHLHSNYPHCIRCIHPASHMTRTESAAGC